MTVPPFFNVAPISGPPEAPASQVPAQIALHCELVRGTEDQVLNDLIPRVRQESLALDLSEVERIDAAGIAVLIALYSASLEARTGFYVVNPSVRVLDMLRLVGLESILMPVTTIGSCEPELSRGFSLSAA